MYLIFLPYNFIQIGLNDLSILWACGMHVE